MVKPELYAQKRVGRGKGGNRQGSAPGQKPHVDQKVRLICGVTKAKRSLWASDEALIRLKLLGPDHKLQSNMDKLR